MHVVTGSMDDGADRSALLEATGAELQAEIGWPQPSS